MTAYEQSMAELVRRVEALEDRRNEHFAEQTARIVAGPPDAAERLRQDRWHATYNAALMSALGSFDGWSVETLHEHSVECADRAHGPLAVKAAAVIPPIEHASWKMFADPRVEALVRAARAIAVDNWAHGPGFELPGGLRATTAENVRVLYAALQPFEDAP